MENPLKENFEELGYKEGARFFIVKDKIYINLDMGGNIVSLLQLSELCYNAYFKSKYDEYNPFNFNALVLHEKK